MYIHIGNKKQISNKSIVGIFNIEALQLSSDNDYLLKDVSLKDKSIAVYINNETVYSNISSYTLIKRGLTPADIVWQKPEAINKR